MWREGNGERAQSNALARVRGRNELLGEDLSFVYSIYLRLEFRNFSFNLSNSIFKLGPNFVPCLRSILTLNSVWGA